MLTFGGGEFCEFGELSTICQTKTIKISSNLWLICLFTKLLLPSLHPSTFAKCYCHQTFPLYSIKSLERAIRSSGKVLTTCMHHLFCHTVANCSSILTILYIYVSYMYRMVIILTSPGYVLLLQLYAW